MCGEIPPELGNLISLQELVLSHNQLTGELPPEIIKLINLQVLTLADNQLSGEIPLGLGNLVSLQVLGLGSFSELTGCVPNRLKDQLIIDPLVPYC